MHVYKYKNTLLYKRISVTRLSNESIEKYLFVGNLPFLQNEWNSNVYKGGVKRKEKKKRQN